MTIPLGVPAHMETFHAMTNAIRTDIRYVWVGVYAYVRLDLLFNSLSRKHQHAHTIENQILYSQQGQIGSFAPRFDCAYIHNLGDICISQTKQHKQVRVCACMYIVCVSMCSSVGGCVRVCV